MQFTPIAESFQAGSSQSFAQTTSTNVTTCLLILLFDITKVPAEPAKTHGEVFIGAELPIRTQPGPCIGRHSCHSASHVGPYQPLAKGARLARLFLAQFNKFENELQAAGYTAGGLV